ncbi:LysR family transcriptional regulator [Cohnella sp.]|uniref:LysR family transcriptional regulator n=1 Tax=Cohnella sp. TaxID=1883426 RepID=UPI003703D608
MTGTSTTPRFARTSSLKQDPIARNGNFTRAAQELHIAQPALSKQMSRLEQILSSSANEAHRFGEHP